MEMARAIIQTHEEKTMTSKVVITFRNVKKTAPIVDLVQERYMKLKKYYSNIIRATAVIELPHKRKSTGNDYRVQVEIKIPGTKIVGSSREKQTDSDDLYSAITQAFHAVERQLITRRARRTESRFDLPIVVQNEQTTSANYLSQ